MDHRPQQRAAELKKLAARFAVLWARHSVESFNKGDLMRVSVFLLALVPLAGVPMQAEAALVLDSLRLEANHDLANAYLLVGDASGPASAVAAIKLGDYLVGTGQTRIISLPPLIGGSSSSSGNLQSLGQAPPSAITYTIVGVYNISAPQWDMTIALPKGTASNLLGNSTWNDVFATAETDVAKALVSDDVYALQSFFVTAGQSVGFATVDEQAQLLKFCIAHDGGTVSLTTATVPEPASVGLVVIGLAGLMLRRRRGHQ